MSRIGIFDSGIGGITVLDAIRKILPCEDYVYLADSKNAPYGVKSADEIRRIVKANLDNLLARNVKAIVAGCNTATAVMTDEMRNALNVTFVGLEPALKPAVEATCGKIIVLTTLATANSQKFATLLHRYKSADITVLPQASLASDVEKNVEELTALKPKIEEIFKPYPNVDAVVLGCTHYVFLYDLIKEILGEKVKIFHGNDGVAKRLRSQLQKRNKLKDSNKIGDVEFIFTK